MDMFRTLIIPVAHVNLARQIALAFGEGGASMWLTPLSATYTVTHYISSGFIPEQFAYMVPEQTWEFNKTWQKTGEVLGDANAVYGAAIQGGIDCTLADVQALFANSDVTAQEPFIAMGRLGLNMIDVTA